MSQTTPNGSERSQIMAAGFMVFAAVMLITAGVLDVFRGIMAIARDEIFVHTPHYIFEFDVTGWGWIHLILGALAVLVGLSLFKGALWARILGVALAVLLLISSFLSLPYDPFWSIVLIALYVFIIWALCVVQPEKH